MFEKEIVISFAQIMAADEATGGEVPMVTLVKALVAAMRVHQEEQGRAHAFPFENDNHNGDC